MKRLLLLGGGHAHVHVLHEMARERFASAEVTLVTPFLRQMYSGMVPGVVAGHYRAEQAAIALAPLAAAAGATVVESAAVNLDAARRVVRLANGRSLGYDVLSIDTGSTMDRGRIAGARANAIFVRPIEQFLGEIEELLDAAARRALDVVVVGSGAAGVELALALQHRLTRMGRAAGAEAASSAAASSSLPAAPGGMAASGGAAAAGIRAARGSEPGRGGGRVALVLGGERPLAGYPEAVVRHAERALQRARVTLFRDTCAEVRLDAVVLGSGARLACDAAVLVTGGEAAAWLAGSGLALDAQGFVATGPTLQSGSHPEVFAVGDVACRLDAPHPRSGVYAVRAGPPLAANLRATCSSPDGQAAAAVLKRHMPQGRTLNLISCGSRRAIASWGPWAAAGRWVWWWKNHIDRAFVARYKLRDAANGTAQAHASGPAVSARPAAAAPPGGDITPSAGTR